MRKLSVAAFIMAIIMIFAGCNLVEVNQERDMQQIVAKVDGKTITKDEYANAYYYNAQIYMYYYGYDIDDLTTDDMVEYLQEYAIESMISQKIFEIKAEEYGCYDFTDEELDEINTEYNELMDTYRDTVKAEVEADEANEGKTQEELDKLIEEGLEQKLEELDIDADAYLQSLKDQKAVEKLEAIITETDDPTESELQSVYNENVESQKASYTEDASAYESALLSSTTIYYNLPGTRQVSHILIALPDDVQTAIEEYRENGDDESADALREEELAIIKDSIDEVYALAVEGADFDELIAEYGEDPGMESSEYYSVVEGSTSYASEFVEGLFSLENIGDFTEPVGSDFGYHIIKYVGDIPEGAIAFEDVKEEISQDLIESEQEELYAAKLEEWREAAKVKIYNSRLSIDLE